ncbi:hypothetical protein [Myxococcus hansupus]|uniref:hypothetical protein n=1 Tax=Pseudomyxococcus hansupus TaxID=1297742 RepID=UPI0002729386|nr:hypothetical protein [Myxococcus hansupus]
MGTCFAFRAVAPTTNVTLQHFRAENVATCVDIERSGTSTSTDVSEYASTAARRIAHDCDSMCVFSVQGLHGTRLDASRLNATSNGQCQLNPSSVNGTSSVDS